MRRLLLPKENGGLSWKVLVTQDKVPSPLRLAILIILTLGTAETIIMLSLPHMDLTSSQAVIFDAVVLLMVSLPVVFFLVYRPMYIQIARQKCVEAEREAVINELKQALDEVKTLRGLVPICAWCKNIRDQKGDWKALEDYISNNSDAEFTHSICPECYKEVISRQETQVPPPSPEKLKL